MGSKKIGYAYSYQSSSRLGEIIKPDLGAKNALPFI